MGTRSSISSEKDWKEMMKNGDAESSKIHRRPTMIIAETIIGTDQEVPSHALTTIPQQGVVLPMIDISQEGIGLTTGKIMPGLHRSLLSMEKVVAKDLAKVMEIGNIHRLMGKAVEKETNVHRMPLPMGKAKERAKEIHQHLEFLPTLPKRTKKVVTRKGQCASEISAGIVRAMESLTTTISTHANQQ